MKKNLTELVMPIVKHSVALFVFGGIITVALGTHQLLSSVYTAQAEVVPSAQVASLESLESSSPARDPFADLVLEVHAAYVYDLAREHVLFVHNEDEQLPLASLTKLMTALVARDAIGESAVITLTADDLATEGDTGLRMGERWRNEDLIDLMLLVSSNDAAHAVARFAGSGGQDAYSSNTDLARERFIQRMNDTTKTLGFATMEFFNESGLDIKHADENNHEVRHAGGLGSAREVATLIAMLWGKYPEALEATAQKDVRIVSQDDIVHALSNTNEITGHIPGLIASKTGYTDLAGGNLAVIFDIEIGHPIVAVVLGSSYHGRFDDMQKIVQATLLLGTPTTK